MATRSASKVYISDTLVIKALNTPGGSGGVARDLNKTVTKIKRRAIGYSMAELKSSPLDATHRGSTTGTYRRSFKSTRRGNGHILVRTVYNDARHAGVVETGRKSTHFGQKFYNDYWPGWPMPGGDRFTDLRSISVLRGMGRWERFGWSAKGGRIMWYAGTGKRDGHHILARAFRFAVRKYGVTIVPGKVYKVGALIPPRPR